MAALKMLFLHLIKRKEYLEVSVQRSHVAAFIIPDEESSTKGQNMGSCSPAWRLMLDRSILKQKAINSIISNTWKNKYSMSKEMHLFILPYLHCCSTTKWEKNAGAFNQVNKNALHLHSFWNHTHQLKYYLMIFRAGNTSRDS